MPPADFLTLPVEVHNQILSYVTNKADLKQCCFVSKYFHKLTVPFLYHEITFKVPQKVLLAQKISQALGAGNIGIKFIRLFHVKTDYHNGPFDLEPAVRSILLALSPDTLRTFGVPPLCWLPLATFIHLLQTQQKLDTLTIGQYTGDGSEPFTEPIENEIYLGATSFRAQNEDDLQMSTLDTVSKLARSMTGLKTLSVDCYDNENTKTVKLAHAVLSVTPWIKKLVLLNNGYFQDSEHINGETVHELLFESLSRMRTSPPYFLTDLKLCGIDFTYLDSMPIRGIYIQSLLSLHVEDCYNFSKFLKVIHTDWKGRGRELRLQIFRCMTVSRVEVESVELFLQSFTGLRRLLLCFRITERMLSIASVVHHGESLKTLQIEHWKRGSPLRPVYSDNDFEVLTNRCRGLRELWIGLPEVSLSSSLRANSRETRQRITAILSRLPNLHTLAISPHPAWLGAYLSTYARVQLYFPACLKLATDLFRKLSAKVLIFGRLDIDFNIHFHAMVYERCHDTGAFGDARVTARQLRKTEVDHLNDTLDDTELLTWSCERIIEDDDDSYVR